LLIYLIVGGEQSQLLLACGDVAGRVREGEKKRNPGMNWSVHSRVLRLKGVTFAHV